MKIALENFRESNQITIVLEKISECSTSYDRKDAVPLRFVLGKHPILNTRTRPVLWFGQGILTVRSPYLPCPFRLSYLLFTNIVAFPMATGMCYTGSTFISNNTLAAIIRHVRQRDKVTDGKSLG